jgi:hypothetical protein
MPGTASPTTNSPTTNTPFTGSPFTMTGVTARVKGAGRDLAASARSVVRDVSKPAFDFARGPGATVAAGATATATRLRGASTLSMQALPKEALPELAKSVYRLRKVRTPAQARVAAETETERLLTVITPLLVAHPLPVQRTASAKAILATAGGLAAASEEIETIAALVSAGTAVPPTIPVVIGANLVALAVELYVAASLRTHDLRAAGIEVDPQQVADDVIFAMTGEAPSGGTLGRHVTNHMVRVVAARLFTRWGAAFVPVVGIAYAGWDTQRTADAIRALPLPARSTIVLDQRLGAINAAPA